MVNELITIPNYTEQIIKAVISIKVYMYEVNKETNKYELKDRVIVDTGTTTESRLYNVFYRYTDFGKYRKKLLNFLITFKGDIIKKIDKQINVEYSPNAIIHNLIREVMKFDEIFKSNLILGLIKYIVDKEDSFACGEFKYIVSYKEVKEQLIPFIKQKIELYDDDYIKEFLKNEQTNKNGICDMDIIIPKNIKNLIYYIKKNYAEIEKWFDEKSNCKDLNEYIDKEIKHLLNLDLNEYLKQNYIQRDKR